VNPLRQLRTATTRRLLAIIAGVIVLGGSVTAVAVAALGRSGPIPPAKTLAAAIHDALAGPRIDGVSADIQFTNNLLDTSSIPGAGPLLGGATGRLWADGSGHLRLELQASAGDTEITVAPGSFQIFDVASNTVYRGALPTDSHASATGEPAHQPPTLATITNALNDLMGRVGVSGADPGDVGGAPAYTVTFSPKHAGGLLGSAELAFDAVNGAPLRFAIYAQGNSTPVIELTATQVSFGPVAPADVTVTPPTNAKVVELTGLETKAATGSAGATGPTGPVGPVGPAGKAGRAARAARASANRVTGAAAVAAALPFKLDAPAALAGLPQTSVRLLSYGGHAAALVAYGQHLGGILVLERAGDSTAPAGTKASPNGTPPASATASSSASGLPTVTINGATGTEIATALGTLVRFERGGIDYIVLGSVPPAAAEAAARGL
jgi:hypothetical protein